MTNTNKPITKYVVLKVTYNSYYHEPPSSWDWGKLIDLDPNETVEIVSVSDIPIIQRRLF